MVLRNLGKESRDGRGGGDRDGAPQQTNPERARVQPALDKMVFNFGIDAAKLNNYLRDFRGFDLGMSVGKIERLENGDYIIPLAANSLRHNRGPIPIYQSASFLVSFDSTKDRVLCGIYEVNQNREKLRPDRPDATIFAGGSGDQKQLFLTLGKLIYGAELPISGGLK